MSMDAPKSTSRERRMSDESGLLARQNDSSSHWQRWGGIHMKRVLLDPAIHHGQPVVLGTRVPVTQIAGSLAGGMSFKEIQREYDVTPRDIRASLGFRTKVAPSHFSTNTPRIGSSSDHAAAKIGTPPRARMRASLTKDP